MKLLFVITLLSTAAHATCFMSRTVCSPSNNFQNIYEIRTVTCSPPGGPATTTKTFEITNKLSAHSLFRKNFNFTRDNYFQAKINRDLKTPYLEIDDRSLPSDENVNISTSRATSLELTDYACKEFFN